MRLINFLMVAAILLGISGAAQAKHHKAAAHHVVSKAHLRASPSAIYGTAQLANELNYIINSSKGNADIAVYVKSMKYKDSLYSRNIHDAMTPASTMKIFTAESALIYLGPDYHFNTRILTDAQSVSNGVLQGNLYIVLSGDPTLAYDDLYELFMNLQAKNIHAISGNVYIDNTAYDQRFYGPGWVWKDKDYCYAAPISASIINHNCLSFKLTPTVPGRAAQIVKSPNYFYPAIRNSIMTKAKRSRACSVRLSKGSGSTIGLDGCMPAGSYAWGVSYVVTDVPDYNRTLFKSLLAQLGIRVYGAVTFGSAPDNLQLIGSHASKPLGEMISDMLKKSDNIIAGALFKKLGQLYSKQPGSWENGSLAVSQILSRRAGVNISGMRILDGSGLSPDNLASPAQMMQVLDFAYHHSPTSYEFISALPIAGVDGTLKHRMYNIARKVRAKTGTISGVASLAGYAVSADKEPLAFVIMINGGKGMGWSFKETEDKIATALTRYKRS
jgi:D-alanyl-D-alanine carboxypeptidase/D-alanyl-D-alanine-endopeptidase (penicillin-binding protein 4)